MKYFGGCDVGSTYAKCVILDENGNVNRNIVSAWINSSSSLGTIHDVSTLSNIKNVKGDEKPEIDGDKLTWDISEDDLYYQGETNKSLPISVNIKYELNGQEVSPKDIQGKTGKFKITLSLKNNESREVKIGNKNSIKVFSKEMEAKGFHLFLVCALRCIFQIGTS